MITSFLKQFFAIFIVVTLVVAPIATIPQQEVHAQSGFFGGVVTGIAGCLAQALAGIAIAAVNNFFTTVLTVPVNDMGANVPANFAALAKECVIDPLVNGIKQYLLEQLRAQILNYAGGGGAPIFVQNFLFRLQNVGINAVNTSLNQSILYLDAYWANEVAQRTREFILATPEDRLKNLAPACIHQQLRLGQWGLGGGSACFKQSAIGGPGSTLWGAEIQALREAERAAQQDIYSKIAEIQRNQGFEDDRICEDLDGDGETQDDCVIVTPGSTRKAVTEKSVTSVFDEIIAVDEIGEAVRLLVVEAIQALFQFGLSELSNSINGQPSFTSQLGGATPGTDSDGDGTTDTQQRAIDYANTLQGGLQAYVSDKSQSVSRLESSRSLQNQVIACYGSAPDTPDATAQIIQAQTIISTQIDPLITPLESEISSANLTIQQIQALVIQLAQSQTEAEAQNIFNQLVAVDASILGSGSSSSELQIISQNMDTLDAQAQTQLSACQGTPGGGGSGPSLPPPPPSF